VSGRVRLIADPAEQRAVLERFRAKYGDELFLRWYDHPARVMHVDLAPGPATDPDAHYTGWIEAEFDNIARDYDRHILGNPVNRLLRDRSLAWLRTVFSGSHAILEVGCGSGMETLPLLREGHEVTAVDISEEMLEVVLEKARSEGVAERLRCVHVRARDLGRLVPELGERAFDGAYSTYGALNCEPDLRPVVSALGRLLPPGRSFVAGVYNRWCLFEVASYALTLRPSRASARWRNPVRVGSSRFCVDVFAFSAPEFRRRCAPEFTCVRTEGVPVVMPPSDLADYTRRLGRRFDGWARWDAWVGRRWPGKFLGDHFLMTFTRSSEGS